MVSSHVQRQKTVTMHNLYSFVRRNKRGCFREGGGGLEKGWGRGRAVIARWVHTNTEEIRDTR